MYWSISLWLQFSPQLVTSLGAGFHRPCLLLSESHLLALTKPVCHHLISKIKNRMVYLQGRDLEGKIVASALSLSLCFSVSLTPFFIKPCTYKIYQNHMSKYEVWIWIKLHVNILLLVFKRYRKNTYVTFVNTALLNSAMDGSTGERTTLFT